MGSSVGNLYGVDIKIANTKEGIKPVTIEINGINFGTDFFKYDDGFPYYESAVKALAQQAAGKPIFLVDSNTIRPDELSRRLEASKLRDEWEKSKASSQVYGDFFTRMNGRTLGIDNYWLDDTFEHLIDYELNHTRDESESRYYKYAANNQGIDLKAYTNITFNDYDLTFELSDNKKITLRPGQIGMIWAHSEDLYSVPKRFAHLFLNDDKIETVQEYKPLVKFISDLTGTKLADQFPRSMPYGMGINDKPILIGFIDSCEYGYAVSKRPDSSQGGGVRIHDKRKLTRHFQKEFLKEKFADSTIVLHKASCAYILEAIAHDLMHVDKNNAANLMWALTQYEEFLPSIPITNPHTGKQHDGCARAVVYSAPGKKPKILGMQWRLAPSPMDSDATLEQKLRANLSRGAIPANVSSEHNKLISEQAIRTIEKLELTIKKIDELRDTSKTIVTQDMKERSYFDDILLTAFFMSYYPSKIKRLYGYFPKVKFNIINPLVKLIDKFKNEPLQSRIITL